MLKGVLKGKFLCVGMGKTNMAAAAAILKNGGQVIAVDDFATPEMKKYFQKYLQEKNVEIHFGISNEELKQLYRKCDYAIPTPGLADTHPIYALKREKGAEIISELDYAYSLLGGSSADKLLIGITGTNGKSTVVEQVCACLRESGIKSVTAGNTEVPFSQAILENPDSEVFVVEASSFQLRNSRYFAPRIAAWLNFAPNHLDKHSSLKAYEKAKAKIWAHISEDDYWVANESDAVVWRHRPKKGKGKGFGMGHSAAELNIEASRIIAKAAGASREGIEKGIKNFDSLPHRMELIAETDEIKWINDSKATTPHAVLAGLSSLQGTVLLAGGRDKAGNFQELRKRKNIKAVVAFGESAPGLVEIFRGVCPVAAVETMKDAVLVAAGFAKAGETVLFSPGGSSFDWYGSYEERGEDFKDTLREVLLLREALLKAEGESNV